jgi:chromatin assembly factor 1 subunit A
MAEVALSPPRKRQYPDDLDNVDIATTPVKGPMDSSIASDSHSTPLSSVLSEPPPSPILLSSSHPLKLALAATDSRQGSEAPPAKKRKLTPEEKERMRLEKEAKEKARQEAKAQKEEERKLKEEERKIKEEAKKEKKEKADEERRVKEEALRAKREQLEEKKRAKELEQAKKDEEKAKKERVSFVRLDST